jgi:FkbM family methyltransferase
MLPKDSMIGEERNVQESGKRIEQLFAAMKQEDRAALASRWRHHYDGQAGSSNQLVLFGAGQFGRIILGHLGNLGQRPVCFSDNNPARWNTTVEGIEVLSPADAVSRYGASATFVVSIYNGSAARQQLREAGVRHVVSAMVLPWKYPEEFIPELGFDRPESLLDQEAEIRQCFKVLSDERSRQELCDQIQWRFWMSPEFLPLRERVEELYFPEGLWVPDPEEVMVDCGAFDGDTIRSILARDLSFRHLYALEPDPGNRAALCAFLKQQSPEFQKRVTVWPYGVSDENGTVGFAAVQDVTSSIVSSDEGISVECRKLDDLDWSPRPTYIKMDIEGAEPQALGGAAGLLRSDAPVLAVCLYHRSEHFWQIVNQIHASQPDYSIFVRRYAEDGWESVCYAVPRNRLKNQEAA